jgi:hypothetical protein
VSEKVWKNFGFSVEFENATSNIRLRQMIETIEGNQTKPFVFQRMRKENSRGRSVIRWE